MPSIGGFNKQYVSSTAFLDQREILNKVLDITNEQASFLDVLELSGRSVVTNVPQYHHFVNEELYVLGSVASHAVSGNPLFQGVAFREITFTAPKLNQTMADVVSVGELAILPDGNIAHVKAVSGNAVTFRTVDGATIDLAKLTTSAKVSFFSNASGEGSLSPASKKWDITKYMNQVQIFKAKFDITDIQKASKVEVEFQGKPFFMYKGQHESLMKFRGDIAGSLLFSRISTGSSFDQGAAAGLTDAEGKPVQTTMGLDQYAQQGIQDTLTSSTQLDLGDIKRLTQSLNARRAPLEYFIFLGTAMNIYYDNLFNSLGNSALLSTAARFDIGKNVDLGVDSFKIYGRTYHKKYLPILDHKNITAYTGGPGLSNVAYMVPADKQKTVDGQVVDRMRVRYMANDGTDLKYREILLGGLAPTPTNERSVLEIHYESVQGLEILGSNFLVKQKMA